MRPCTSRCTRKHTGWKEACDDDKPRCLPRSSPRLWERMGKNAKETRRSQAYSSKVVVGGGWRLGVKEEGGWMLFPTLILPVCRDHMCVNQALEHPFCLFCLFWSVPLLSPSLFLLS